MKLNSFNRNYPTFYKNLFFLWILTLASGIIVFEKEALSKEEALYNAQGKRDPFIPLISLSSRVASGLLGVETFDELVIEGIVHDPGKKSIVIVNGAVMNVGEEVGSVKLIEVRPDGALFAISGVEGFKAFNPDPMMSGSASVKMGTTKPSSKKRRA